MAESSLRSSTDAHAASAAGTAGPRDRAQAPALSARADAVHDARPGAPTRNTPRNTPRSTGGGTQRGTQVGTPRPPLDAASPDHGRGPTTANDDARPLTTRERGVLELVTRLRLVPLALVRQNLFPDVSRQVAGRIVGKMVERGWLQTWAEPTATGGTPRWLFPTRRGQREGLAILLGSLEGSVLERLARTMAPSLRTRPLSLVPHFAPPFLRHQRETCALILALSRASGALWHSAWDRPLPEGTAPIALPQPDGVLVLPDATGPALVFLEHDRGMESPTHFARAKAERYAELAVRPELCEKLFGFPTFRLAVTVEDARARRLPLERLGRLARLLSVAGVARESVLTLAGWAAAHPADPVWCRADDPFLPARPRPVDQDPDLRHALLCPALRPGSPCACRAQLVPPSAL